MRFLGLLSPGCLALNLMVVNGESILTKNIKHDLNAKSVLDETKKVENVKLVSLNGLAHTVYFGYNLFVLMQTLLGVFL